MIYSLFDGFKLPVGEALLDALIGLVFVFIVLAFLVGIFVLYNYIYAKTTDKNNASNDINNADEVIAENIQEISGEDDDELTAVIIAAISAVYESEQQSVPPFKVKNIKLKY